jgi:hypothetical protein
MVLKTASAECEKNIKNGKSSADYYKEVTKSTVTLRNRAVGQAESLQWCIR